MIPLSYGACFCLLVGIVLAVLSIRFDPHAPLNRTASIIGVGYSLFAFASIWVYGSPDIATVWFFYHLSYIGAMVVVLPMMLWGNLIIAQVPLRRRTLIALPFFLGWTALYLYDLKDHTFYTDFIPSPWGRVAVQATTGYGISLAVLLILVQEGISWTLLLRQRSRTTSNRLRRQVSVLAFGSMATVITNSTQEYLVRTLHLPNLDLFEALINLGIVFFMVARYRYLQPTGATLENEILRTMKEGVLLFESDLRVRKLNPVTRAIFHADERELLTQPLPALFDQADDVRKQWEEAVRNHRTTEVIGASVQGSDVELVLAPTFDDFNDVVGGIALVRKNDLFGSEFRKFGITAREQDVLQMLLLGYDRNEIASSKYIAPSTVKNHIHNIYEKTGASNRVELLLMLLNRK